jgi:hypothetical protein
MMLSILIILHLSFSTSQILLPESMSLQEPRTSIISYNAEAMPIAINTAVAENRATDCWLTYSVTNKSQERIERIELLVFIVDGRGRLISTQKSSNTETINAGVTQQGRAQIPVPIKHNGVSIMAVTRVVGQSGVWAVDLSDLKAAVANQISGRLNVPAKVGFEENINITGMDRGQIFKLVLNDFLNDSAKADRAERIKDGTNVLVLSDNIEFDPPRMPNVKLSKLDKEEIRKLADERGRVFYLIYRPFVVEGVRVMARLSLREERAQRLGTYVPYKFTYVFTCTKKEGRWIIEESLGYAES